MHVYKDIKNKKKKVAKVIVVKYYIQYLVLTYNGKESEKEYT